jgi:hypothetical protein
MRGEAEEQLAKWAGFLKFAEHYPTLESAVTATRTQLRHATDEGADVTDLQEEFDATRAQHVAMSGVPNFVEV